MSTLENSTTPIKVLVKGLTNEEINSVRRYLNCFDEIFGNTKTKTANLFDLVISEEILTDEEIMFNIYSNTASIEAFDKLSKRLVEKIHECLLLDINVERKDAYPDYVKATIDVRKKIMQAHILLGRALTKDINGFYDKIIIKAKKFELYSELVEVLHLKQMYLGLRNGSVEYNKIGEEIVFYENCRVASYKACDAYYKFVVNNDFSSINKVDIGRLEEFIMELKGLYTLTNSANVGYFLFLMEFELFQKKGLYEEAKSSCLKLVELIQENPAIYQKRRLGSAFVNLSINELHTYDFKASGLHARLAQDYFNKNTINHGIAKETEFYSYFFQGDLDKADSVINSLLKETNSDSEFLESKRSFLAANVAFLMNEKKNINLLLNETNAVSKDKEGWNIGIRILSIMSQIEAGVNDPAEAQVESMRKHIERTMKDKDVRGRDVTILRILNELVNQSFDFAAVWKSRKQLFDQLASEDKDQRWEMDSHELIIFHEWFKSKVFGTVYPAKIENSPKVVVAMEEEFALLSKVGSN